ncbi:MAG: hypothetical protein QM726_04210 [Chitinophagaceae bacterium]
MTTIIDWALLSKPTSIKEFTSILEKENISLVLRENKEGIIYGLSYIDHKTKTVFNGSDLGKAYSSNAIQEKLKPIAQRQLKIPTSNKQIEQTNTSKESEIQAEVKTEIKKQTLLQNLDALQLPFGSNKQQMPKDDKAPIEPSQKKKKKRKRMRL